MSVLVYTESENGKFKKNAFEVASYASAVAQQLGTSATAISIHAEDPAQLGSYGIGKVLNVSMDTLATFNANAYAQAIAAAAEKVGAQVIVLSSSADTKFLAPLLAGKLGADHYRLEMNAVGTADAHLRPRQVCLQQVLDSFGIHYIDLFY